MHRAGRASLILDRMSEHKLHAVYVKKKKQSLYIHSCIFYTKDQEKTSSQIKRFSEGMQRSVTVVTVTTVTWDCTTFRAEEPEKKRNESHREGGLVRVSQWEERVRERAHSLFLLSFFTRADWEPARSRETMTTRQPTLATNSAFAPSEADC